MFRDDSTLYKVLDVSNHISGMPIGGLLGKINRVVKFTEDEKIMLNLSPSRRREAPCEGTNSPRLFTPGETKALAKSKVHQWERAWVTVSGSVGGHPHWSQKDSGLSWIADTDWSNLKFVVVWQMTTSTDRYFMKIICFLHYSILYVLKKLWQLSKQFVI
jgi:hypothetical protein